MVPLNIRCRNVIYNPKGAHHFENNSGPEVHSSDQELREVRFGTLQGGWLRVEGNIGGYIGIMEKKMETIGIVGIILGYIGLYWG